jgi:hypothetical protein
MQQRRVGRRLAVDPFELKEMPLQPVRVRFDRARELG